MRIAKWLGDGCMIVSVEQIERHRVRARPRSTARPRCARRCRCGSASPPGYALLFEGDDYIGSAVNMASRLCDIAGPFEVLMPTMQLERLPEGVTATPHGEVELRGFPGPIDVVELSGARRHTPLNDTGELWTAPRSAGPRLRPPWRAWTSALVVGSAVSEALFDDVADGDRVGV